MGKFIAKRSLIIIIATLALTVGIGFFIPRVGVKSDILSFLPPSDPAVKEFKKIGEVFGGNSIAMVIIQSDSVFSRGVLERIKTLEDAYRDIEGVGFTQSLISMIDIKKVEDGIEVSPLIGEDIPSDKKTLDSLRNYILSREMYKGVIVSDDGKYTAIIIRILEGYDRDKIALEIRKRTEKLRNGLKVYYTGIPLIMTFVNEIILSDLKKLFPLTVILLIIILGAGFRRPAGIILPLSGVLIAVVWSIGLMGLFKKDFSIVSNIMPVLLLAVGSAYGIHVINRFYEDHDIAKTISHIGFPVLLAALTTMVGFFSFLTSNLIPIREFGFFTGLGVLVACASALFFIPAVLNLTHRKGEVKEKSLHLSRKVMSPLSNTIVSLEKYIIIIMTVLFILTLAFSPTIERSVNTLHYFKPNSPIRVSMKIAEDHFGGSTPIMLDIKGDMTDPEVLNTLVYIEKYLNSLSKVAQPQSIADLLMETNYNLNGIYAIPETREKVQNLYFFLEGQEALTMMITPEKDEALLQANDATKEMDETRALVDSINCFISNLKNNGDWTRKILEWDLRKLGINAQIPTDLKTVKVPAETLSHAILEYLNSEDVAADLTKQEKKMVVLMALRGDTAGIVRLGGIDGKYLLRDIRTLMDDVKTKYRINYLYDKFIHKKLSENEERIIKGDLYYLSLEHPPRIVPNDVKIIHTGLPKIYVELDKKLLLSLFKSMGVSIVLVFLMLLWQLRSVTGGLISLIPIIFTVVLNFGIMEIFRIPLDEATMLISSLAIGMGIDYVIHFTSRLKLEMKKKGKLEAAIRETIETTGMAIIINAVSVAAGFLALLGAELIPLRRFGILVAGTMIVAALSAITILPALILRIRPGYIKNSVKEV